ncbi:accessory Sec system S-layer assembly protein [Cytobacillus gottheilii]|uniref:accessory Sec system S-layer assembly protein n=1 Tax=Cytobacillus gottheilii TaxID=859144 RepID=UPI00082FFBEB|nr:accessory Sec system S-layer assembly protein [Cytobacillus gottheilii]
MGILSIFRRKNKEDIKMTGLDSSVSSTELLNETDEKSQEDQIHTELSLHPSWNVENEQLYVLRFLNNDLAPLKPNQISLAGIELNDEDHGIEVTAFVRNSLAKGIKFHELTLVLLDADKKLAARHTFDLGALGEVPGRSSRPWTFIFPVDSIVNREFSHKDWTLAIELKEKHKLDLHETWVKAISTEQRENLEKLVSSLEAPKPGEVNFYGLNAQIAENKDLQVTMLLRNGHEKNVAFHQLPLIVEDAAGEKVAEGSFKLEDFELKANTSRPWTFIFPASLVKKENPDLSKWRAYPIQ